MGHWNYRVMKREVNPGDFEFGIYDVFYDQSGKVISWTEESLVPMCPSEEGLLYELEEMKTALDMPTLIYEND
jgi:hypothetical protein